jgi:hypothetical protein
MNVGRVFALCDAQEQADFLNEAGRTLRRVCGGDSKVDMQLCMLVDHLDHNGKALVKGLAAFIAIDEEGR